MRKNELFKQNYGDQFNFWWLDGRLVVYCSPKRVLPLDLKVSEFVESSCMCLLKYLFSLFLFCFSRLHTCWCSLYLDVIIGLYWVQKKRLYVLKLKNVVVLDYVILKFVYCLKLIVAFSMSNFCFLLVRVENFGGCVFVCQENNEGVVER